MSNMHAASYPVHHLCFPKWQQKRQAVSPMKFVLMDFFYYAIYHLISLRFMTESQETIASIYSSVWAIRGPPLPYFLLIDRVSANFSNKSSRRISWTSWKTGQNYTLSSFAMRCLSSSLNFAMYFVIFNAVINMAKTVRMERPLDLQKMVMKTIQSERNAEELWKH